MNTDLLRRILDKARDDAPTLAEADEIRCLMIDVEAVVDLDPKQQAPNGLLDAVHALYLACGDEGSEEAEAVSALPSDLNEALADVIRFGADL